jgi:hypothetical protein
VDGGFFQLAWTVISEAGRQISCASAKGATGVAVTATLANSSGAFSAGDLPCEARQGLSKKVPIGTYDVVMQLTVPGGGAVGDPSLNHPGTIRFGNDLSVLDPFTFVAE